MDGGLAAVISIVLLGYALFCMVMIPAMILDGRAAERECARVHQVFSCEMGPWVPATPEAHQ